MKIFKFVLVFMFVSVMALSFTSPVFAQDTQPPACDPLVDPSCPPSTEPTIPLTVDQFPWISVLLVGLVTWVVTEGLKSLSKVFGVDISGKASAVTATVVLTLVELINQLLATIPESAIPSVTAGLGFVFTLLSAFGLAGLLKKLTAPKSTG